MGKNGAERGNGGYGGKDFEKIYILQFRYIFTGYISPNLFVG